jgi:putative transposase
MSIYEPTVTGFQFADALAPFVVDPGLPLAQVLTADDIQQVCAEEGVAFGRTPRSLWTPPLVLWTFLAQVLSKDKSCRDAVSRVLMAFALTRDPDQVDTAAYCRARAKLPAVVWQRLALQVGWELEKQAEASWLWGGRHVHLVDGFTVTLPDTPANRAAYPPPPTHKPGLGFPLLRLVGLLSLATAAVQGLAFGPYQGKETGETALFRQLLDLIPAGHVVLADRFYCSWFLLALLQQRGIDVVMRLHQRRRADFRRGQRLGPGDHRVHWPKPDRPEWMDEATYVALPETLEVREVYCKVDRPGFRVRELIVVTTLLDADRDAAEDLTNLYHQRWQVELDIRVIKSYLRLEHLRCRTPFMVEKELWAHFLGYNLVCKVRAQAAVSQGVWPRSLSFTAAQQLLNGAWQRLTDGTAAERQRRGAKLLRVLAGERVGDRPDRCEPRAVKRRPKPHKLLNEPRDQARAKLLQGQRAQP